MFATFPQRVVLRGTELVRQGEPAQAILMVSGGLLKEVRAWPDGASRVVGLRYPGGILGLETATVGSEPVTLVTLQPTTLREIPLGAFSRLRATEAFARVIQDECCRDIRRQREHVARLSHFSARDRLEDFIVSLMRELGQERAGANGHGFELPLRECELAELLAITPQYMCRLLHEGQANGRFSRRGSGWVYHSTAGPHEGAQQILSCDSTS
jgi:CRP/FNR family transcriptional regulator